MHIASRIVTVAVLMALFIPTTRSAIGQDTDERRSINDTSGRLVYASFYKVPWARVDSLIQLESIRAAVTEKGVEMGCYEGREFLIHHSGDEYNVVFKTYYKKWGWPSLNPGCGGRAYRAAVPDADQRAAINAGNTWVFDGDGSIHKDVLYWEPYPNK